MYEINSYRIRTKVIDNRGEYLTVEKIQICMNVRSRQVDESRFNITITLLIIKVLGRVVVVYEPPHIEGKVWLDDHGVTGTNGNTAV